MGDMKEEPEGGWSIGGLAAGGPLPELREKLMLFGQFVGDWDIYEGRYVRRDGTWANERGELHWRWILDGRAVQDVWSFFDEKAGRMTPAGTTIRYYDANLDAWHSLWISPLQNFVKVFLARKVGEEIVLEGKGTDGNPTKWTFSEIKENSFRWRSEESKDEGRSWALTEEMHIRRAVHERHR